VHFGNVCCALARHIASKNYLSPTRGSSSDRGIWGQNWGNYWRRWPEAQQLPLDVGVPWLRALSYQRHINKYAGRTKGHVQTGFAYPNPLPRPLCTWFRRASGILLCSSLSHMFAEPCLRSCVAVNFPRQWPTRWCRKISFTRAASTTTPPWNLQ